jgi:DNA-binding CsgD family transcriptional regulator
MTPWHPTTHPDIRNAAETTCTPKQLEVLKLASHDLSTQAIADILNLTRQAVHQRRQLAIDNIRHHLNQETAA